MSVSTNIRDYLLNRCFDLDLIAQKLNRDPEKFKQALNDETGQGEKITADELAVICFDIAHESPEKLLGLK